MVVGFIYMMLRAMDKASEWMKLVNEGKKERAEIYAKPVDKLGDKVEKLDNTLERLDTNVCNLAEDRRYNTEMIVQIHGKVCNNNKPKPFKKEAIHPAKSI